MTINHDIKIPLKTHSSESVNNINLRTSHLTEQQTDKLLRIVKVCPQLFSEPDEKLTYTTTVKGEIRTNSDDPVYSKSYPYPMALKNEVEKQINEMLQDGIIRPSRSPYNSPVWVVPKKLDASGKKKYRLVIDYRKLNTVTIPDRYPIPEISEVLANLGKNQFFTIADLKSGFHQIPLKESDIEKTAFSVNNGKYEFTRLPFGLKNAPSIFQRTLDDILREHIGQRCYVYIDDIVIFGKSEAEHFENIEKVFKTLETANMKIQLDKCEFLQSQIEFLGFIISKEGIKTNPKKIQAIVDLPIPKTLKELRSFLGMSGYYRRFIKDYAKLAKPLTSLLRGEDGRVSKNISKNKTIQITQEATEAFQKIKNSLTSKEVLLIYPDFDKEFELTTDASNYAIGAVLSQQNKPITFLSRTLNKTEESYAANEKEMLAIIWALNSLRNFLYGSRKVKIFTDHQPLTYALSHKNSNSKMKRWKAILEEYNYELKYKPGTTNVVADTLSRLVPYSQINSTSSGSSTQHSDESSSHNLIISVETPINAFRNQLILNKSNETSYQIKNPFPKYCRHTFSEPEYTKENLIGIFKRYLSPNIINGIMADEPTMGQIQEIYRLHFNNYKIRFANKIVTDISNETAQEETILKTHKRAHRNAEENRMQIIEKFYFPKMSAKIKKIVNNCRICKENKYERHPNYPYINPTPIPNYPGHMIHLDIFSTEKNLVLTAIDKLTKFALTRMINSKSSEDIRRPLREILFFFCVPEYVIIDGEKSLNSASLTDMMEEELGITVYTAPPYRSEVNGQIERFHSTLAEIMRCLKADEAPRSFQELVEKATNEYNHTIHSTTKKKPVELYLGRTQDPQININRLKRKQEKDIQYHNKKRKPIKKYEVGQTIFVKHNKRIGSKLTVRFNKEIVKVDKNTVVITESGRKVHKSNIRN